MLTVAEAQAAEKFEHLVIEKFFEFLEDHEHDLVHRRQPSEPFTGIRNIDPYEDTPWWHEGADETTYRNAEGAARKMWEEYHYDLHYEDGSILEPVLHTLHDQEPETEQETEPIMERLMTAPELAEMLDVQLTTLANWRRLRKGPNYIHIGTGPKSVRYRNIDVSVWLEEKTTITVGPLAERA